MEEMDVEDESPESWGFFSRRHLIQFHEVRQVRVEIPEPIAKGTQIILISPCGMTKCADYVGLDCSHLGNLTLDDFLLGHVMLVLVQCSSRFAGLGDIAQRCAEPAASVRTY